MSQLHEVLAAETDLKAQYRAILDETIHTMTKKQELFSGQQKVLRMSAEDRQDENQDLESQVNETIDGKLDYMWNTVARAIDVAATKENTNGSAKADVVVNDEVVLKDVPVTVLLSLENQLDKLFDVYKHIPTLSPTLSWEKDTQDDRAIMKSNEIKSFKTEKRVEPTVLYPATKEHPAQVKEYSKDVVIGTINTTHFSGLISPGVKSTRLGKITDLRTAVKEARQRANTTQVIPVKYGEAIKDFINS